MFKLNTPKHYALIVGIILFAFGFLGFAFRTTGDLPIAYLLISLILGFWGIVLGMGA